MSEDFPHGVSELSGVRHIEMDGYEGDGGNYQLHYATQEEKVKEVGQAKPQPLQGAVGERGVG